MMLPLGPATTSSATCLTPGGYLFLRYLIRDEEDIIRVVKVFAALTFIFALTMTNEKFLNQNIFGYVGSVPILPTVREGSVRAQAAFAHPILAGAFGVALIPCSGGYGAPEKARSRGSDRFWRFDGNDADQRFQHPVDGVHSRDTWLGCLVNSQQNAHRSLGFVVMLIALHLVMKAPF